MIKKVFVGVFLAIVFGLLVFGAVNRTLAKNDDTDPLALSKNLSEGNISANINQNKNQSVNKSIENNLDLRGQGNGQSSNDCDEESHSDGTDYRRGAGEQGNGSGTAQGGQPEGMPGNGLGQVEVNESMTYTGTVVSVTSDLWVVELSDGTLLELEGRTLSFLDEQEFSASEGDEITITGFFEDAEFKVAEIANDTSGERIKVRDQNGRPLWAGGRQQGGGQD